MQNPFTTLRLRLKQRQLEALHRAMVQLPAELTASQEESRRRHEEHLLWLEHEAARKQAELAEHMCRLGFEIRRLKDQGRINVYA